MTDFWSQRNEGRDDTHVAAGYGRDFAKRVRTANGGGREQPAKQYTQFRETFFHDPKLNTRLKHADVKSDFNLGVDNTQAWKTTGKTWSRETRFPRGRCAMDKPVYTQRLYHPQNHTLKKSSSDSLWGLSGYDTTDRFRRPKAETSENVGPGAYLKQPQWDRPHTRDEASTPSFMFKSISERTMEGLPQNYSDIVKMNAKARMESPSEHHLVPIGSPKKDFHPLKSGTNGFAFGKDPRRSWIPKSKKSAAVVVRTGNNSSYTSTALSESMWDDGTPNFANTS